MTDHTPKPWIRKGRTIGRLLQYADGTETMYGVCMLLERIGETQANAQLLLSAPELLEACTLALEALAALQDQADTSLVTPARMRLRDAVWKATGLLQ